MRTIEISEVPYLNTTTMERQDLYETLQHLYGQMNPIVDEIVQEYADPCYLFNISFEYTNRNDGCFNDIVHIRFEVPVSKVPHAMITPEGTKVILDLQARCFECIKHEGNYRVTLFVPYPGRELSETSDSRIFTIELMKKYGEGGYAIPLLTERKLNTFGEPCIANFDIAHSTVIGRVTWEL